MIWPDFVRNVFVATAEGEEIRILSPLFIVEPQNIVKLCAT